MAVESVKCRHGPSRWWSGLRSAPLWASQCWGGNPDASLSVLGVHATRSAGGHAEPLRAGSIDSIWRRGASTRAGRSARTHPRSRRCRGHSRGRCVPARHSACNCTADRSSGLPPCFPHAALDKAAHHWHKGKANVRLCARAVEGPGFFQERARAFVYSASGKQDTASTLPAGQARYTNRSHRDYSLAG
jgi:hypothetical protein